MNRHEHGHSAAIVLIVLSALIFAVMDATTKYLRCARLLCLDRGMAVIAGCGAGTAWLNLRRSRRLVRTASH